MVIPQVIWSFHVTPKIFLGRFSYFMLPIIFGKISYFMSPIIYIICYFIAAIAFDPSAMGQHLQAVAIDPHDSTVGWLPLVLAPRGAFHVVMAVPQARWMVYHLVMTNSSPWKIIIF